MLKKIAIFCGGPSSEYEVSINSAKTIYKFLDPKKYLVSVCLISKDLKATLLQNQDDNFEKIKPARPLSDVLKIIKKDGWFAFIAPMHGEFGEDGQLQKILEKIGISYSGTHSAESKLCMDKYKTASIVKGIKDLFFPVTYFTQIDNAEIPLKMQFPFIVKPNTLGSSVGVHIVYDKKDYVKAIGEIKKQNHVKEILLQEYINDAVEISCGCLQNKKGSFVKLPPIEIRPQKSTMFDYSSKYEIGGSEEISPPISLDKKLSDKISNLACKIHKELGCKMYSRSDFRIKDGKIYYLETNTLPGMTNTSLLPQEAAVIGITFPKLLDFLIENSWQKS